VGRVLVEDGYPVVVEPRIYKLLWPLAVPVFKAASRYEVLGKENIPRSGPAILAPNHRSYIDIPLVSLTTRRVVHFMGKAEIWDRKLGGWISTAFGGFPVKRGMRDRAALATALFLLRQGELVCVFPEGTRLDGPEVGELQQGVAYLAEKSGAPIVPIGIWGADRLLDRRGRLHLFKKVRIKIGEPLWVLAEQKSGGDDPSGVGAEAVLLGDEQIAEGRASPSHGPEIAEGRASREPVIAKSRASHGPEIADVKTGTEAGPPRFKGRVFADRRAATEALRASLQSLLDDLERSMSHAGYGRRAA
jgi:1-acyl-sn-glycerol-3-phosphate acyltransferase